MEFNDERVDPYERTDDQAADQQEPVFQEEAKDDGLFRVPEYNLAYLRKRFDQLVKRAGKLGCEPPKLVEAGTEEYREKKWDAAIGAWVDSGKVTVLHVFRVEGQPPKFDGWTFVAAIDSLPENAGNVIRVMPGETLPPEYRTVTPSCDHCKHKRTRINHYVVRNTEGVHKMVGSGCIRDFLGHLSPEHIARMATFWATMGEALQEECNRGGAHVKHFYETDVYLRFVAAAITKRGWTSGGYARASEGKAIATSSQALEAMLHRPTRCQECKKGKECYDRLVPSDADADLASKALTWAASLKGVTDFDHNMKLMAGAKLIPEKGFGIAAAIVYCYKREVEKEILRRTERAKAATSEHLGTVGDKITAEVTVVGESTHDGDWGITVIYRMADSKGNRLTWFSSRRIMELGKTYTLRGTIKKLDDYQGIKTTVVTRCKVEEKTK